MKLKIRLLCLGIFLATCLQQAMAQKTMITGKVKNKSTGEPLNGATISNEANQKSAFTDANGDFSIQGEKGQTLSVVYVGMTKMRLKITNTVGVEFLMEEGNIKLDEVVVVGYGTQKITKVSGAINTIKSADIEKLKPVRAEEALQGRASGVTVISPGSPGAKPTVLVRGIPSYSGANPLVVVDGSLQTIDDLNSINASDIESISILKDAASTAIYGVKGGNGVIIVTTKSGRKNRKAEFSFSSYYGMQEVARKIGLLNATEYGAMLNEGSVLSGGNLIFTDLSKLGVGTDWQDQVFKKAPMQSHSMSARGGGEKMTYFLSAGYTGQGGIVGGADKSYFNRYNATSNLSFDLTPKLKLITNTSFVNIKGASIAENAINSVLGNALNFDPTVPVYNTVPNTYGTYSVSNRILSENYNPLTQLDNTHNYSNTNKLYGKIELQYNILKNLSFTSRYGYTNTDITGKSFQPLVYYGDGHINSTLNSDGSTKSGSHNSVAQNKNTFYSYTFENYANYNFKVVGGHSLETVLGFSMAKNTGNAIYGSRQDVPFNSWDFADISAATGTAANSGLSTGVSRYERRNLSFFGRFNYDYKERYLASVSLRRDGSYAFGKNNKYGNFPSFSLGWNVSSESFYHFKPVKVFKIRGSYGITGNENVNPQFERILSGIYSYNLGQNTGYTFGNDATSTGAAVGSYLNEDLRWEKQKQLNLGFDAQLFDGKLSINADYYEKNIDGLLFQPSLSLYLGTAAIPSANVGKIKSNGFDVTVGYNTLIGKQFKLTTNVSLTTNKTTVTTTNGGLITGGSYGIAGEQITRFEEGYTPGYFFGYKTNGLFQTLDEISKSPTQANAQPGDIKYADVNGDGVIDAKDRTQIGNPFPKYTIGWNLTLEYKGFDFNTFVYVSLGNDLFRAYERNLAMTNKYRGVLGRWTGPGSTNDARNPRFVFADVNNNTRASDRYIEDGSFAKLKNVQLGYTIPATLYRNKVFSKIRVYAQVKNAVVITKYSGYDPEITNGDAGILETGVDRGAYPQSRIYAMGIDFKF